MRKPRFHDVGVLDIDGTMMTKSMELNGATASELAAAHFVRDYFGENGTFTVASAQTAEMLMSSDSFERSSLKGFARARPLLGGVDGARSYVRPEDIACRVPFLDADAIMSMGTGSYFRQRTGWYGQNKSSEKRLGGPKWRSGLLALARMIGAEQYLAPIEFEENYRLGKKDVMPLEYRVQFEFKDTETKNLVKNYLQASLLGLKQLKEIGVSAKSRLDSGLEEFVSILGNVTIVDESDPRIGKLQFYAMPRLASKEEMIDDTLALLTRGEMIENLLIAGDQVPDLRAGCFAGRSLNATFLLVGGSPLTPYFTRGTDVYTQSYAGEDISWMRDQLWETRRPGFEILRRAGNPSRMIVFGDVAYPGLVGPESIQAYLQDPDKPTLH